MKKVVNAKRIVSLILVLLLLFAFQQVAVFAVGNNQQAKTEATPVITTKTTSWNYLDNNTKPEDNWKTDSNYDTTQWKLSLIHIFCRQDLLWMLLRFRLNLRLSPYWN